MDLTCPRCQQPMAHHALQHLEAWTCRRCAGALVSASVEKALEAARQPRSGMQRVLGAVALEAVRVEAPVRCPVCQAAMERRTVHGVDVDTCPEHGTWYDRAELRRILETLEGRRRLPLTGAAAAAATAAMLQSSAAGPRGPSAVSGTELAVEAGLEVIDAADVLDSGVELAGDAAEVAGSVVELVGEALSSLF